MIKAVIFDMDGVIIDSEPIYSEVDKKMFKELNININQGEIESYIGKNSFDMWTEISDKYSLKNSFTIQELIDNQRKLFVDALGNSKKLSTIDGVIDWMKHFKNNDVRMIIASSSPGDIINFVIERFQLKDFVEGYIDGDSVKKGKPNPEIFLRAAQKLNVKLEECIVIEDSHNGVKAAKSAGMKCLGFRNKNSGNQDISMADYIFSSYSRENLNRIMNLF